jgi:hypothetical protein
VVFPLIFPFGGRPPLVDRAASGVPTLPQALLPSTAHLRLTALSVPPATSAQAYHATTETPLGQKNHQKWCLGHKLVICAISSYSDVARAPRSSPNDRSNALSPDPKRSAAVQASTHLHAPSEGPASLPTHFTRSYAPPLGSTHREGLTTRRHTPAAPPTRLPPF